MGTYTQMVNISILCQPKHLNLDAMYWPRLYLELYEECKVRSTDVWANNLLILARFGMV